MRHVLRLMIVCSMLAFMLAAPIGCEREPEDHMEDAFDDLQDAADSVGDAAEQTAEDLDD